MDNSERLKRLLLELPWLSKNKSVSIEDFCKTFSVSRDQAVNDLTLLTFVGPSQFGGDLVDIQVSNNSITVVSARIRSPIARSKSFSPSPVIAENETAP